MTPRILACLALALLSGPTATADGQSTGPDTALLAARADSLERADPARDARAAVAHGDTRLLAVNGAGLTVPGVPRPFEPPPLATAFGLRILAGGSDSSKSAAAARLRAAAYRYAERYNRELLRVAPVLVRS